MPSMMISSFQKPSSEEPLPTATITFRMGNDMVYLPVAKTYKEALEMASQVFPRLTGIDSDQICLTLTVNLGGRSFPVRISPMSWPDIRRQVVQYEIIDVAVADKPLWVGIKELEETSPSLQGPPPAYVPSATVKRAGLFSLIFKKNI